MIRLPHSARPRRLFASAGLAAAIALSAGLPAGAVPLAAPSARLAPDAPVVDAKAGRHAALAILGAVAALGIGAAIASQGRGVEDEPSPGSGPSRAYEPLDDEYSVADPPPVYAQPWEDPAESEFTPAPPERSPRQDWRGGYEDNWAWPGRRAWAERRDPGPQNDEREW